MIRVRSIFIFMLVLITVTLVSFGHVAEAKPLSYTSAQIEEIQPYVTEVTALRDRLPELATLIEEQNWTFVRNFIHGPLGELRAKTAYISRSLRPEDQAKARELAKDTFKSLVAIDAAAASENYKLAVRSLDKTIKGLDAFLELLPQS